MSGGREHGVDPGESASAAGSLLARVRLPLLIAVMTAVGMAATYAYQWYAVRTLGVGMHSDALFAGLVVPQLVLAVVSGSLTYVLVPLLAECASGSELRTLAWTTFAAVGAVFVGLAALLAVLAPVWIPWTVPGFDAGAQGLTVALTRVHLVGMVFTALTAVAFAAYHARHRFLWVEGSAALSSLLGLAFLLAMTPRLGIFAAAWAMALRPFFQVLLLVPGMGWPTAPDWHNSVLRRLWARLRPLLLGSSYSKADQLVDRYLASLAAPGQLSMLYLAQQLFGAGNQVLTKAIANPALPRMAQLAARGEWSQLAGEVRRKERFVALFTVAALAAIAVAGRPALDLVFAFPGEETRYLWLTLLALAGVWVGGAVGQVLTTGYYSFGETVLPVRVGVFGSTLGIALKIAGFRYLGVIGLALATSAYTLLNALLHRLFLYGILERKARPPAP